MIRATLCVIHLYKIKKGRSVTYVYRLIIIYMSVQVKIQAFL